MFKIELMQLTISFVFLEKTNLDHEFQFVANA